MNDKLNFNGAKNNCYDMFFLSNLNFILLHNFFFITVYILILVKISKLFAIFTKKFLDSVLVCLNCQTPGPGVQGFRVSSFFGNSD